MNKLLLSNRCTRARYIVEQSCWSDPNWNLRVSCRL